MIVTFTSAGIFLEAMPARDIAVQCDDVMRGGHGLGGYLGTWELGKCDLPEFPSLHDVQQAMDLFSSLRNP
jgi:hypothetical protein